MSVTLCLFCCLIVILSVNNVRCQCIVLILACCIVTYWSMLMDLLIVNLFNYYNHLCYNYSFNLTCVMFLLFFSVVADSIFWIFSNKWHLWKQLAAIWVQRSPKCSYFAAVSRFHCRFHCLSNMHGKQTLLLVLSVCLLDPPEFHQGLWCGKVIKSAM